MNSDVGNQDSSIGIESLFGHYKIVSLLGRGGMGEVYEAEHTTLHQSYALKVMSPEVMGDKRSIERFRFEAQKNFSLNHPNIVKVDDFGDAEGRAFIRMELIQGVKIQGESSKKAVNLEEYAKACGGYLDQKEAASILSDILKGIVYAHEHGIIHRDLKPSNILLTPEGAKVADFGLVKVVGDEFIQSKIRLSVSKSRVVAREQPGSQGSSKANLDASELSYIGTYDYMSPEQKDGQEATESSDLFAIGLIAHRLLTGKKVLGMKRPSKIREGIAKQWDAFIAKATDFEVSERYDDAKSMLSALEGIKRKLDRRRDRFTTWVLFGSACLAAYGCWHFKDQIERNSLFEEASKIIRRIFSPPPSIDPPPFPPEDPVALPPEDPAPLPPEDPSPLPPENPAPIPHEDLAPLPPEDPAPIPAEDPSPIPPEDPAPLPPEELFSLQIGQAKVDFLKIESLDVWVSVHEISNEVYRGFFPNHDSGTFSEIELNQDEFPVVRVTILDVLEFCKKVSALPELRRMSLKARIPSAEEWLTIALGEEGTQSSYLWGSGWPPSGGNWNFADDTLRSKKEHWSVANGYRDGFAGPGSVYEQQDNRFGVKGLGGNVWEFVSDGSDFRRIGGSWRVADPKVADLNYVWKVSESETLFDLGFRIVVEQLPRDFKEN